MPKPNLHLVRTTPPEEHPEDADDWGTTAEDLLKFLGQSVEGEARAARDTIRNGPLEADARALAQECKIPFDIFATAVGVCIARAAGGEDYTGPAAHNLAHELNRTDSTRIRDSLTTLLFLYNKQAGP